MTPCPRHTPCWATPATRLTRSSPPPGVTAGNRSVLKLLSNHLSCFIRDSRGAKVGTLTSCVVFTSYVTSVISSGSSVVSSHSTSTTSITISRARAVDTLTTLVTLILKATIYPLCTSAEESFLLEHQSSINVRTILTKIILSDILLRII